MNAVLSKNIEVGDCKNVVGVDVNESNITIAINQDFMIFENEGESH